MAFFLSLAFSRGWIGPEMRVALGLLVGFGLLPVGALLFDRDRPTLGHVLVAVGLGTVELALLGSRLYELAPAEVAMLGALVAAIAAGFISVRWNSQLVAGMGIAAVLAAPPIVSAPASLVTVGFLGVVLVAAAYVSLRRAWHWLPWLSFLLTAPQLMLWLAGGVQPAALLVVVLGSYWTLFVVSAVLPVIVGPERRLASPIALLGSVAAFVALAAYFGFSGADAPLRGLFIGALSTANVVTGLGLVRRRGPHDDLAQSALGIGLALYVVACALVLEGVAIPIAWTLVMVVVAWVWARFGLRRAGVASTVIGTLIAFRLLAFDYLVSSIARSWAGTERAQFLPYVDGEGVALTVFLGGLAVAGWLSNNPMRQQVLAAGALLLVALTVPMEAGDLAPGYQDAMILLGLAALALIGLAADRLWNATWDFGGFKPLPWMGAGLGLLALIYLGVQYELLELFAPVRTPAVPLANEQTLVSGIVVIGLWLLAATRSAQRERVAMVWVSLFVVAALLRQQLPLEWAVAGWSLLAVGVLVASPLRGAGGVIGNMTAGALLAAGAGGAYALAPLSRLVVGAWSPSAGVPPNAATLALLAIAGGLSVATWRELRVRGTQLLAVGILVAVVYMLSVGLVDTFAMRATDPAAIEEIGKQAQVALSILWAVIGLLLLGVGLARDSYPARGMGLGLLALATVKVFAFDLAFLDVAYRVLSLIGLGLLLLAGAYGYQRLRRRADTELEPSTPGQQLLGADPDA